MSQFSITICIVDVETSERRPFHCKISELSRFCSSAYKDKAEECGNLYPTRRARELTKKVGKDQNYALLCDSVRDFSEPVCLFTATSLQSVSLLRPRRRPLAILLGMQACTSIFGYTDPTAARRLFALFWKWNSFFCIDVFRGGRR